MTGNTKNEIHQANVFPLKIISNLTGMPIDQLSRLSYFNQAKQEKIIH